jgi:hypothetical protein
MSIEKPGEDGNTVAASPETSSIYRIPLFLMPTLDAASLAFLVGECDR